MVPTEGANMRATIEKGDIWFDRVLISFQAQPSNPPAADIFIMAASCTSSPVRMERFKKAALER